MYRRASIVLQRLVKINDYNNKHTWLKQAECFKRLKQYKDAKAMYLKLIDCKGDIQKKTLNIINKSLQYANFRLNLDVHRAEIINEVKACNVKEEKNKGANALAG